MHDTFSGLIARILGALHRLLKVARPKGFEPLTSASGGRGRQYNRSKNLLKTGYQLHATGPEWTTEDLKGLSYSTLTAQSEFEI